MLYTLPVCVSCITAIRYIVLVDISLLATKADSAQISSAAVMHQQPEVAMRKATLSKVLFIQLDGLKSIVKINSKDVMEVRGTKLVRLAPHINWIVLVCEDNPLAPDPVPKKMSIRKVIGYNALKKLRNDCHIAEFEKEEKNIHCNLFDKNPVRHKKEKNTRAWINAQRDANADHSLVAVQLEQYGDVKMLRPVQATDGLWVEYTSTTIASVMNYLRASGFSQDEDVQRDPSVPQGFWKRKDCFVVMRYDDDGSAKYKRCNTIEDGKAWLAELDGGDNMGDGHVGAAGG